MLLVSPVLIDPLFNTYKPLEPGPRAECGVDDGACTGVPADEVYAFDASRQTQARQRQRQRLGEHGGDPPQRQPLEPHLAARDPRG